MSVECYFTKLLILSLQVIVYVRNTISTLLFVEKSLFQTSNEEAEDLTKVIFLIPDVFLVSFGGQIEPRRGAQPKFSKFFFILTKNLFFISPGFMQFLILFFNFFFILLTKNFFFAYLHDSCNCKTFLPLYFFFQNFEKITQFFLNSSGLRKISRFFFLKT